MNAYTDHSDEAYFFTLQRMRITIQQRHMLNIVERETTEDLLDTILQASIVKEGTENRLFPGDNND